MVKRIFDVVISLVGIITLFPVIIIVALLVRINLGSPVIFKQVRPGLGGIPFEMLKFRTMNDARGPDGKLLPDSERITPFGSFLRKSSLDELVGLWNVLKGDMSLVGPRPLLMEYLDYYTEEEKLRHTVRPGLTGLAQVSGRNLVLWDERLALDVKYVKEKSFFLDLKILFMTVFQVIRSKDVVAVPSTKFGKLSEERGKAK